MMHLVSLKIKKNVALNQKILETFGKSDNKQKNLFKNYFLGKIWTRL